MANSGRGWFGDSAGHSKAGRKGGRARARNSKRSNNRGNNISLEDRRENGSNSGMGQN